MYGGRKHPDRAYQCCADVEANVLDEPASGPILYAAKGCEPMSS